ncbi:MAG: hypothetical protein Q7I94_02325, partial [Candidatus Contubernalis sp.]|nr:hypothetical protein [Candidatus Contubernalis sp.]
FETGTGQTNIYIKSGRYISAVGSTMKSGRNIQLIARDEINVTDAHLDVGTGGSSNIYLRVAALPVTSFIIDNPPHGTFYSKTPSKQHYIGDFNCQ